MAIWLTLRPQLAAWRLTNHLPNIQLKLKSFRFANILTNVGHAHFVFLSNSIQLLINFPKFATSLSYHDWLVALSKACQSLIEAHALYHPLCLVIDQSTDRTSWSFILELYNYVPITDLSKLILNNLSLLNVDNSLSAGVNPHIVILVACAKYPIIWAFIVVIYKYSYSWALRCMTSLLMSFI